MNIKKFIFINYIIITSVLGITENKKLNINKESTRITPTLNIPIVTYADILDNAIPSVVSIYSSRIINTSKMTQKSLKNLLDPSHYPFSNIKTYEEKEYEIVNAGSGVIISENGYIVTNRHVIQINNKQLADKIQIKLNDNTKYTAELISSDKKTDIAVLKINSKNKLPAIKIADSDTLKIGDIIFSIGNPQNIGITTTKGIISALERNSYEILGKNSYENFIQTDASINLGNSGGALIDSWGRLIGINTAIVSNSNLYSNIGFAIPVNMVINIAKKLIETGKVERGLIGIHTIDLTTEIIQNINSTHGILIKEIKPNSPAQKKGLECGDIITKIDNTPIKSVKQLRIIVSQISPGIKIKIHILRKNKKIIIPIILETLKDSFI